VVVASNHNPTILNPDFLVRNRIIGDDWDWKLADDPIATPVFARVSYESGFSITAQPERVVFSETDIDRIPDKSPLGEVAAAFVETLPHVTYKAVGVNPKACLPFRDEGEARAFISERFFKEGPWLEYGQLQGNSMKLVFDLSEGMFLLSIDTGQADSKEAGALEGVILQGNVHHDVTGTNPDAVIPTLREAIQNWRRDYELFMSFLRNELLGELE